MRRRKFIALLGGAALARPWAARAQQPAMPVIGVLSGTHLNPAEVDSVKKGLADGGYKDGANIQFEYRSAEGQYDRLPALAHDLVARNVAVIVAIGGTVSAPAAKAATTDIPIVFANGADPVKLGLVASLNRPGGNVTGACFLVNSLGSKRIEVLHELLPAATPIGLLVNPNNPSRGSESKEVETAVTALGKDLRIREATGEAEIDAAFAQFAKQRIAAFTVVADAYFRSRDDQIVGLAAKYRMPGVYPREEYVTAGGLMSYAPRPLDAYRLAGAYAGRILKGEKPSDLPVQLSDKVYFTINLKTAKVLGLAVPPNLLALADEVIE
jgi:putative ABC transport system substrate-binding protein